MIVTSLNKLYPTAQFGYSGEKDNFDEALSWQSMDIPKPKFEDIEPEVLRLEAETKATQYQKDRANEYKKLNQFAMQFDDSTNGTSTWIEAINEIKAKYPKPVVGEE